MPSQISPSPSFFPSTAGADAASQSRAQASQVTSGDSGASFDTILSQQQSRTQEIQVEPDTQASQQKPAVDRASGAEKNKQAKDASSEDESVDNADNGDDTNAKSPGSNDATAAAPEPQADVETPKPQAKTGKSGQKEGVSTTDAEALAAAMAAQTSNGQRVTAAKTVDEKSTKQSAKKSAAVNALDTSNDTDETDVPAADLAKLAAAANAEVAKVGAETASAETPEIAIARKGKTAGTKANQSAAHAGQKSEAGTAGSVTSQAAAKGNSSAQPGASSDLSPDVAADAAAAVGSVGHRASATDDDVDADGASQANVDGSLAQNVSQPGAKTFAQTLQSATTPAPTAEARFADANHAQIVSAVHADLLPNGGTMKLRLDPPELGALHVTIQVRDGMVSANFQASSDQAARLLSHSLGDLKSMLETQGVSVDKLHVSQAPRSENVGSANKDSQQKQDDSGSRQDDGDGPGSQREQQRQEMLRKMWARVAGKQPVDLVA